MAVRLCRNTARKSLSTFNIACLSSMDLKTTIHIPSYKNLTVSSFHSHQNRRLRQNNSPKPYILCYDYTVSYDWNLKKNDALETSNCTKILGYFWIKLNHNTKGIEKKRGKSLTYNILEGWKYCAVVGDVELMRENSSTKFSSSNLLSSAQKSIWSLKRSSGFCWRNNYVKGNGGDFHRD